MATSLCALNFSRFLARLCGWYGIAVLPCFSASGKVPVTRCDLPLRGTYAVNVSPGTHRREVRGVLSNRNCTGASRASTSCRRRAAFTGRSLYILGARTHHPKRSPPWRRRLDLNQRIPPGAVLYRLSYVCISPAFAGVRRKERMDGKNEDTDITPHPHSDTYFSTLAPNLGQRPIFFAIL